MANEDRVLIFDTTLRDGEQSPGVALNVEEKLEIARALERMRVDIIEAGFPASSPGDLESVTAIAKEVKGSVIAGLARAVPNDIDACWEAVRHAERPRIHVFLSSSDIHIMHQLEKDKERVLEMARDDGGAGEEVLRRRRVLADGRDALGAGVRLPDADRGDRGRRDDDQHPGHRRLRDPRGVRSSSSTTSRRTCRTSTRRASPCTATTTWASPSRTAWRPCRRARGRSRSASTASASARATPRSKKSSMAIKTRPDFFDLSTGINTTQIHRTSRLVSQLTGMIVQPNKSIVGVNAFRHQSGIHQHGMTEDARDLRDHRPGRHRPAQGDAARPEQELRPPRPEVAPGRPGLRTDDRGARPPLRRLQGPGGQEGRDRRPRPRRARLRRAPRDRGRVQARPPAGVVRQPAHSRRRPCA